MIEFENALIGNALFDPGACDYAFGQVRPDHFLDKTNAAIWEAIQAILRDSLVPDMVMVSERLKNDPTAISKLMEAIQGAYTATTCRQNANMVLDSHKMRESEVTLIRLLESVKAGTQTVKSLKTEVEALALGLAERTNDKGLTHVSKIADIVIGQMKDVSDGIFPGVRFGFRDLDEKNFFLRNGTLNYLAARPAMGKSAFALSIAKRCGQNVALYTMEMGNDEQYQRLLSPIVGMCNNDYFDKAKLDANISKIERGIKRVNDYKIWLNDDAKVTTTIIYHQCKRMQNERGLGLVIIDYTGLVKSLEKNKNRQEIMGNISLELKAIATDLKVPILSLAQLNRDCEKREDKRPQLSDLRESGGLEQDAHMVMSIYRDEVYKKDGVKGHAELIFLKNRGGRIGMVPVKFNGYVTDFTDWNENENFIPQRGER